LNVVRHLIVKSKVANRDEVQSGINLRLPVFQALCMRSGAQFFFGSFTAPVAFKRKFQFTVFTNSGKAQCMRFNHGVSSFMAIKTS
jgi:hypothetical protein